MRTLLALLALAVPAIPLLARAAPALEMQRKDDDEFPKLSPFEAVRWKDGMPEVMVAKRWYSPRTIGGLDVASIVRYCNETFGNRAVKRFEEDLVQVLTQMGSKPGEKIDLDLTDLESKKLVTLRDVPMTKENRRAIWTAANSRDDDKPARGTTAVTREHAKKAAPEFADLARPLAGTGTATLARSAACADLDALEVLIDTRYAYRDRAGFDYRGALDAVRIAVGERISPPAFALLIAKVLARFGDGHTRIDEVALALGREYLPCLVEPHAEKLLALKPDRSAFLDPAHPVLVSIDGLGVDRWLDQAAAVEARGSPELVRRRSMRGLRYVGWLRAELLQSGVMLTPPAAASVKLGLASLDGAKQRELEVPISGEKPIYGQRIGGRTRLLDGDVGYLRIASMEDDAAFLDALDAAMAKFRETKGLVIDVRGNGGGSRAPLMRLFPYFVAPGEAPWVANVAACRLSPGQKADEAEGLLSDRWLFPVTASRWSTEDRSTIDAVAKKLVPEWRPRAEEFSAWHFLMPRRADNPNAYFYDRPVAILLDADCFSATDIFLAAFAGRPRVTLVGQTSAGGSGRAIAYKLPNSGFTVRLSSMVSFRRDGRLIDGRGIEPDVRAEPAPDDYVGRGDAMLDAALRKLR
jgi:hypothetical protein